MKYTVNSKVMKILDALPGTSAEIADRLEMSRDSVHHTLISLEFPYGLVKKRKKKMCVFRYKNGRQWQGKLYVWSRAKKVEVEHNKWQGMNVRMSDRT